jgi:Mg2+/citrate symporter
MTWLTALLLAAIVAALVTVFGVSPSGARPAERSGLMSAARVALLVFIAIVAFVVLRSHG